MAGTQGINRIRDAIEDIAFPITRAALKSRVGDVEVRAGDETRRLSDLLDAAEREQYTSQDEVIRDIEEHVPAFNPR